MIESCQQSGRIVQVSMERNLSKPMSSGAGDFRKMLMLMEGIWRVFVVLSHESALEGCLWVDVECSGCPNHLSIDVDGSFPGPVISRSARA